MLNRNRNSPVGAGERTTREAFTRDIRVRRLRLIGGATAPQACPCTDPPRLIRYLRYATYVLAIAIFIAVSAQEAYGAAPHPPGGPTTEACDPGAPEGPRRLDVASRPPLRTSGS